MNKKLALLAAGVFLGVVGRMTEMPLGGFFEIIACGAFFASVFAR